MKSFTSTNLDVIRHDIDEALKGVAKKHGIALNMGSIKYSNDQFHTKLEAFIQDASTSGMNARQIEGLKNLKNYGSLYNVSEKDYGKQFKNWDGQMYKLVGLMPNRPKYPVLGESVKTGKLFKFTETVLEKLQK